jgi:transcriptional regulator with XRE-family HTH domain
MFTYQIKEARERLGVQQGDLAREACMDRSVLSQAEHGNSPLRADQLRRLELALSRLMARRFQDVDAVLKDQVRLISEVKYPGRR